MLRFDSAHFHEQYLAKISIVQIAKVSAFVFWVGVFPNKKFEFVVFYQQAIWFWARHCKNVMDVTQRIKTNKTQVFQKLFLPSLVKLFDEKPVKNEG